MIKYLLSASIVLTLSVCSVWAQPTLKEVWESDPRMALAARNAREVMETVALAIVGSDMCKVGDSKPWYAVIAAVDARHAYCAKQDQKWIALSYPLAKEEEEARKQGLSNTVGTLLFLRAVSARGSRAVDEGPTFCTRQPWKMLLDPEKVTTAELQAYKRAEPGVPIETALTVMKDVLALGKDKGWIEAPCDQNFWPAGFVLKK